MAIYRIPKRLERTWNEWDLRGAVLVSLLLQLLLILLAASRKRTRKFGVVIIVWTAYLMADSIAVYAVGLITNNQSGESDSISVNSNLAAFWAPFLLLHLGGPDSITAFSIEDNELWIRHLLGLTVQLVLVVYVLLLAIPNPFWVPSVLVFLVGTVKYGERTVALYQACLESFMDSLLPHLTDFAFKVMEVELNFMYDELFTKMGMLYRGRFHHFFRVGCSVLIWTAFSLFVFKKKANIHTIDIAITYALLVGAIVLDFIGLVKVIFSDWMVATTETSTGLTKFMNAIRKWISFDSRWSGKIYQHNLISYVSRKRFGLLGCVVDKLGLSSTLEEILYKHHTPLGEGLKNTIFEGLKKSAKCDSTKRIMGAQRGGATIEYYEAEHRCDLGVVKYSVSEVEYDHGILLWHIATDLLYQDGISNGTNLGNKAKECKILSDYMLYLLAMSPILMMPSVSSAGFQPRFDKICQEVKEEVSHTSAVIGDEEQVRNNLLLKLREQDDEHEIEMARFEEESLLRQATMLAKKLKSIEETWELMMNMWLEFLCYAAKRCRGSAHAQHLSKGGELITFVSLLMHHLAMTETFASMSEYSTVLA